MTHPSPPWGPPHEPSVLRLLRLLLHVLKDTPHVLHIDLDHQGHCVHGDLPLLEKLVEDTGYFPALMGMFQFRRVQEQMLAVASRGVVVPTTTELTQARMVLDIVTSALSDLAAQRVERFGKAGKDSTENQDYTKQLPVVIINGLSTVLRAEHPEFCNLLTGWAGSLVYNEYCNVVLVDEAALTEDLNENGRTPVDVFQIQDATLDLSLNFLKDELPEGTYTEADLRRAAVLMGGRLADLRELAHRVAQNKNPLPSAIADMLSKAVNYLRKTGLGIGTVATDQSWTQVQAWSVFSALAVEKEISYDQILFGQYFDGSEAGLRGMDRAGLISLVRAT